MQHQCKVCGASFGLQQHHIVKRSQGGGDNPDNLIWLCWQCHHGSTGVHGKNGRKLDLQLKLELQQKYFERGYSEEKVRKLMGGKIYLRED